jgi:hypothetical protein
VAARPRPPRLSRLIGLLAASRIARTAGAIGVALLAGCHTPTPPPLPKDAHVPNFARAPYEPFARAAAVAIALREWRLFGQRVQDQPDDEAPDERKPERLPGLWQRVGEYWWLGLDANQTPENAWTGKHDGQGHVFPPEQDGGFAWSAAFVSYVMRIAGAGPRFPYSASHADYINAARRPGPTSVVHAERPASYAPLPGDLICFGRGPDRDLAFDDLPAGRFPGHCDIVVETTVGIGTGALTVIGGNVDDAVTMKHVPTTADGRLAGADGVPTDPRYPWFVVIRVLYDR